MHFNRSISSQPSTTRNDNRQFEQELIHAGDSNGVIVREKGEPGSSYNFSSSKSIRDAARVPQGPFGSDSSKGATIVPEISHVIIGRFFDWRQDSHPARRPLRLEANRS